MILYSYNNKLDNFNEIQSLNLDTEKKKKFSNKQKTSVEKAMVWFFMSIRINQKPMNH